MPVRAAFILLLAFLLVPTASARAPEAGAGAWVAVRSENFVFVGDAGAPRLRELAAALEEARAVLRQLLPAEYFDEGAPNVVVVFADDAAYTPFKPLRAGRPDPLVAGYFKPGRDLNYITLAAARDSSETTSVLFHEYVHSLVRNAYGAAPLWLDEGLAEYYSAYAVRPGRRPQARTGPALARRVRTLRAHALIPLAELLAADRQSPLYNDHDRRGIFYAQSWALVHYLMSDPTGGRGRQLAEYVGLTRSGSTPDDAVRRAFRVEPATLARGLSSYVRAGRYAERVEPLARFPAPAATIEVRALGAAEVKARLGDLLLRTDRPEEAEAYLRDAVALDPSLPAARVSLGLLRAREGRLAEAREELRRAVELDPQSHLAHYYHAGLLRLDGADADSTVAGYAERTRLIRAEIKRAVELAPDFLDARALLVLTDIERSPQLEEAAEELARLTRLAPARRDFKLLAAQLDLRREQFAAARAQLQSLLADPLADPALHHEARRVLDGVPHLEQIASERRQLTESESEGAADDEPAPKPAGQPCDMPEPGPQIKLLRFPGEQTCGELVSIECGADGVVLSVRSGGRTLRLRAAALGRVRFLTYTSEVKTGRFECGGRERPEAVLVTYRPARAAGELVDGELKAVEFIPADWLGQGERRSGGN